MSPGSGQHCFSLGGVNILDNDQPLIQCTLMLSIPVLVKTTCVCLLRSSLINGIFSTLLKFIRAFNTNNSVN